MRHELIIDGGRFSDYDGFVREFNRAYVPVLGGPEWDGDYDRFHEFLEAGQEASGEPVTIRWIDSRKSMTDLGHQAMARFWEREMAAIPQWALSPESYEAMRRRYQESLDEANRGQGRTLFEFLVWQMTDLGEEWQLDEELEVLVDLNLE